MDKASLVLAKKPIILPINITAMADLKGENNKFVILDVAQNAVVSHSVSPDAGLIANKPFAIGAGIFASVKMLQKPRNQHAPHAGIELRKLLICFL